MNIRWDVVFGFLAFPAFFFAIFYALAAPSEHFYISQKDRVKFALKGVAFMYAGAIVSWMFMRK